MNIICFIYFILSFLYTTNYFVINHLGIADNALQTHLSKCLYIPFEFGYQLPQTADHTSPDVGANQ